MTELNFSGFTDNSTVTADDYIDYGVSFALQDSDGYVANPTIYPENGNLGGGMTNNLDDFGLLSAQYLWVNFSKPASDVSFTFNNDGNNTNLYYNGAGSYYDVILQDGSVVYGGSLATVEGSTISIPYQDIRRIVFSDSYPDFTAANGHYWYFELEGLSYVLSTTELAIADAAVITGSDGRLYLNAANFNGGATTLTGTAEAGDTVTVSVNGDVGIVGQATVAANGSWTYALTGLTNGEVVEAVATATDAFGDIAQSPAYDFTVDTTISESPISDAAVTTGSDGRLYLNAANFNGGTTTLTGTADPGDTVTVNVNGVTGAATIGADGAWTYTVTGLTNGEGVLAIAAATDPAGNFVVQDYNFIVESTISESPITDAAVTAGSDGKLYLNAANFNGGATVLTGTADPGDTVTVSANGDVGAVGQATVAANGSWTYALTGLTNGEVVEAVATATDAFGDIAQSRPTTSPLTRRSVKARYPTRR